MASLDPSDDVTSSGSSSDDDGSNSKPSNGGTGELASLSETFSFGDRRRKVPCLAAGWFLACISGCIYPAMAFVWARIFEVLGTDPTAPDSWRACGRRPSSFWGWAACRSCP